MVNEILRGQPVPKNVIELNLNPESKGFKKEVNQDKKSVFKLLKKSYKQNDISLSKFRDEKKEIKQAFKMLQKAGSEKKAKKAMKKITKAIEGAVDTNDKGIVGHKTYLYDNPASNKTFLAIQNFNLDVFPGELQGANEAIKKHPDKNLFELFGISFFKENTNKLPKIAKDNEGYYDLSGIDFNQFQQPVEGSNNIQERTQPDGSIEASLYSKQKNVEQLHTLQDKYDIDIKKLIG